MPAPVFISYRRDDTRAEARLIRDNLVARFGEGAAFLDTREIADGADWPEELRRALDEATTVLVVIGPGWLSAADRHSRRRIDDAEDWVRREVESALEAGKKVIPILVNDAPMPEREALPNELSPLVACQRRKVSLDTLDENLAPLMTLLETDFKEAHAGTPVPVRLFFAHAPSCGRQLRRMLMAQNAKQDIFEFDLADQLVRQDQGKAFEALQGLETESKLEFAEAFMAAMGTYNARGDDDPGRISVAITELPFPQNYYTWNTSDRRGLVIGVASLKALFSGEPALVNAIILRVLQRMTLFALGIDDLATHPETRSCLFDFTRYLKETDYLAEASLCHRCKQRIEKGRGARFLASVEAWLA